MTECRSGEFAEAPAKGSDSSTARNVNHEQVILPPSADAPTEVPAGLVLTPGVG